MVNVITSAEYGTVECQANKGVGRMSWRQQAMKDVVGCDKPGGAAEQAEIPGCPNGATRCRGSGIIRV